MSKIARWSYKSVAHVKPFLNHDQWSGEKIYGDIYDIACSWTAIDTEQSIEGGDELVLKHEVFTEDSRPKKDDLIQLDGMDEWEEIVSKTGWDMAMFNDVMDFKLLTG